MPRPLVRATISLLLCAPVFAQSGEEQRRYPRRSYQTAKLGNLEIQFDGKLDEPAWDIVEWGKDFVQFQPEPGAAASQQTQFKIVYDDDALYFGVRAFDTNPQRIESMLARHDRFPGDWVEINIDSYGDRRSGFSFTSSVSGTRGDEFISDDGNYWDGNWNPIWDLATHVDDQGWTLEARIPFSQLRFSEATEQLWGFQVQRRIFREEQRSLFQPKHPDDPGWVSQFAELRGLHDLGSPRRIELLPYGLARGETFEEVPGDPFLDGQAGAMEVGLDGKIGVSSNLTLDFTINPDFGQVEADPSEVNLTAFETFFSERRPFFVEGADIFDWQISPAITGGSFTLDNLFYSRRIGRRPQGSVELADGAYADIPDNTSILGAGKLSGKTAGGISIGVLNAVTAKEKAQVEQAGQVSEQTVEPLTNTMIARLQKDTRGGDTRLGGIFTAVNRDIDTEQVGFMHEQAYSGGLDAYVRWSQRTWYVGGSVAQSYVAGSEEALLATQTSSARYLQRPDNASVDLDSSRTALSGSAFAMRLGRSGGGRFRIETGLTGRTSGFEANDAGFLLRAGEVNQFTWVGYHFNEPIGPFRALRFNGNQWLSRNTSNFFGEQDQLFLTREFNFNFNAQTDGNWSFGSGASRGLEYTSNTELRGGPSSRWPGYTNAQFWIDSDSRRRIFVNFGGAGTLRDQDTGTFGEVWADVTVRPTNALSMTFSNFYNERDTEWQYVSTRAFGSDPRYLFGRIEQETYGMTLRIDYTLTPDLTLQYYGSPFLSSGRYSRYKRITDSKADAYEDRFEPITEDQLSYDSTTETFAVDEDLDGASDYSFGAPDFEFRDFNSNFVLRWEFDPGSSLYLVWSQARTGVGGRGELDVESDLQQLFDVYPHDVFLIKIAKWTSW